MMTICLCQTLIPAHPTNRVLNRDPSLRKRSVEAHVFGRSFFAARFAPRRGAQPLWVRLGYSHIRQVTHRTYSLSQTVEHSRLLEQAQIRSRPDYAFCHIADQASMLITDHLDLEGVLLL